MFNDLPKYHTKILFFENLRTEGRKLDDPFSSPITICVIKLKWMKKAGRLARTGQKRNA